MRPVGKGVHRFEHTKEIGLGDNQRSNILTCVGCETFHQRVTTFCAVGDFHDFDPLVFDDGAHYPAVDRMYGGGHQNAARGLVRTHCHQGRFSQRGSAVIHAGVGYIHAGQRGHHGLVFVEQLQCALACFCLIRGIGGIEFAAGGDLPHCGRDVVFVGAGADEIKIAPIHLGPLLHQPGDFHFAQPRQRFQAAAFQGGRDLIEQLFNGVCADACKHRAYIFFSMGNERHGLFP